MRMESQPRSGRYNPPVKTRYPFYRRLSGTQDLSGRVHKTHLMSFNDSYVGVWCVSSANAVTCTQRSHDKFLGIRMYSLYFLQRLYPFWTNVTTAVVTVVPW